MGTENEIEILDVKRNDVVKRLKELKAKHVGNHKFKRIEFLLKGDVHGGHSWGRIRTDGKETTITLKETKGKQGFSSMKEYEIKTDDFEEAVRIMTKIINTKILLYFENEREAYRLGNSYITIDKWPEIPHFVEIEAPSLKEVRETYKKLKIEGKFVGNAPIHKIYSLYNLDFKKVMGKNKTKLKKLMD
jgi:adenylate cyclase, class 2